MAIKSLDKSSLVTPQTTNSMLAGYSFQDYELIESVFLASSASSVNFNNLNQYATEYKHLQIRAVVSHTGTGGNALFMRINGDSGNNYSNHSLTASDGGISSSSSINVSSIEAMVNLRQNLSNTSFGAGIIDILDFANISKNKTVRSFNGHPSSQALTSLSSGVRLNTEAINSLAFFMGGLSIGANSRLSLYGIR
jgi:hypothetical protein